MEFIVISDNKIKIMLTDEDLQEFEIDADELDYANTDTKRMFWDILSRAKRITGFDTDGQRVLVQLYPSRHGGCEMFVTKIGATTSQDESCPVHGRATPIISEKIIVGAKNAPTAARKKSFSAFSFDSLEDMLSVCRRLSDIGYCATSSAYISGDRRCYLLLEEIDSTGYEPIDKYSFIYEFGSAENAEATSCFLSERGNTLCAENAVQTLCRF